MRLDEVVEVGGADFLLALEDDLHVDRQLAGLLQVRLDGLEVHEDLALVVGRAARVDLAVADGRFKRRRLPQLDRIDRLDVVVAVEEDRRRTFGAQPVAVDDGVAGRFDEPDVVEADAAHLLGRPLGAAPDVAGVLRQGADARNREVGLQLLDVAVTVRVDEVDDVVHWRSAFSVSALGVIGSGIRVRDPEAGQTSDTRSPDHRSLSRLGYCVWIGSSSLSPHSFHDPT